MRRPKRALAIVAFTLVGCSSTVLPASTPTSNSVTLRLYATTPVIPLLNDLTSRYSELHPSITFDVLTGNFQTMAERLMDGETTYLLTNYMPDEAASAGLLAWPVGQDGIAVIVHPDNTIGGLTTEQLRSIYLGYVSNWREVGGTDDDITIFSREDGAGTRAVFERLVMGDRQTIQSAQIAPSSAAMVSSVAEQVGGIGYVSMSYLDSSIRAIPLDEVLPTPDTVYDNLYPLRTTLFAAGLAEPEDDYRDFIGWIQSPEGQAVVGMRYAPLLRP